MEDSVCAGAGEGVECIRRQPPSLCRLASEIRNYLSGAFDRPIPATVSEEKTIISIVFTELNENFCVGLDNPPSFSRSISSPPTVHGTGRTVFVGGSNLGKIEKAAAES